MVTEEDFENAERELVPSVSVKELEHYKRVRAQFEKPEEAKEEKGKGKSIPDWQQQHESRPRSNGKGKGKAVDRKGKGKAVGSWDVDDDQEFYDDSGMSNGIGVGKGKGKAVDMGFQQGTEDDDEGLY
jgi:peroxin-6